MNMPGTTMTMPAKNPHPKDRRGKNGIARKSPAKKKVGNGTRAKASVASKPHSTAGHSMTTDRGAAANPDYAPTDQMQMGSPQMHPGVMAMPEGNPGRGQAQMPMPMDHSRMTGGEMSQTPTMSMKHGGHEMAMAGALGPYPMERESSGTSWQPDTSEDQGIMIMTGQWTLMAHGVVNLVYDRQSGTRGDDKAFVTGMLMGMARRPIGNGALQLKAMVSPDPLMGPSGYPLLLASGETANGRDRLIDRQHPHDFFMELSASVSQNIGTKDGVFLYAGLPGEPAFGPPAFMHREAIMDSPEAPISHHWLDSTHISFGVVTAGLVLDRIKFEVSRFNAREPDQHRWDIETGPLDSTAIRLSWNPARELALQGSWGRFKDPEQLEPGVNQKRLSASLLYAREIVPGWKFAGTLAWGRKTVEHHSDDAYVAEASLKHDRWTLFGRGELTRNRELVAGVEHGPAYQVGKVSLGAVRDFRITKHLSMGAGGLFALNFVPGPLSPLYGGNNLTGFMGFLRLKLN